jgi:hypothetical protein
MNLDVSLNKIKYQPLPFSHAALRCIEFKRMCEQLQHLDLNTLSTSYPQRLNMSKLSQKYIYPHPFNSHIQFCKPIKEGSGDGDSCMCLMGVHICWCGAQRIQVAGGRWLCWGVRVRWGQHGDSSHRCPAHV